MAEIDDKAREHAKWITDLISRIRMARFDEDQLDALQWLLAEAFKHGAKHNDEMWQKNNKASQAKGGMK